MGTPPVTRGFTTAILHSDRDASVEHGALHKPLHLSVAYGYRDARDLAAVFQGRQSGYAYGRQGNPTSAAYVLVGIAFYAVYALLGVRLVLGILAGAVDDVFVWTMVLAIAAFMILHGIVNRVHLARRYRAPDSRLWIGRLL